MKIRNALIVGAAALFVAAGADAATVPAGWVAQGNAGSTVPDGNISAPPEQGPGYYYVSTYQGEAGVGGLPGVGGLGQPTNGSVVTTNSFTALAGEMLEFYFNYLTSDGAGYADYGWARLLDENDEQAALLFTARTTPNGNSVPGYSMPAPEATLDPDQVDIDPGTDWSIIGSSSGSCWSTGCGHTGWVKSTYSFLYDGTYKLQFGVTNWDDQAYDSALAFAGAKVGDVIITPPLSPVPLPAAGWMLLVGLGATGMVARRRRQS